MKKLYTSNGGGDVLICLNDVAQTEIEVVVATGSAPKAMEIARLLQRAYENGRASMAEDMRELLMFDVTPNAKSEPTSAALSREVGSTDGL